MTIDAIGAQGAIAEVILKRGGDYLLALKGNRPATFADVEAFFADRRRASLDTFETTDGDHGRIEVRRHAVCHDVAWLLSDRRYPGEVAFPGLAMIGMVESDDRARRQGRAGAALLSWAPPGSTPPPSPARCAATGGSRTGCTGSWTWCSATTSPGCGPATAPANMAVVKHMAMNLLRQAKPTVSLKNRRPRQPACLWQAAPALL